MLVDTHCHLNFHSYDADRDHIIQRAADVGVKRIINPGIDLETSRAALHLTRQYEGVYAAVGIHPNDAKDLPTDYLDQLHKMSADAKVLAIGEIGLDYYWDKVAPEQQAAVFRQQLELAKELNLPVIIHNREASMDVLPILEDWARTLPPSLNNRPGVLHSFSASVEYAQRALAAGFYLGFTGPITFKNADDLRRVAAQVPLDRILVETDGPYLTPHPYRGKRNEPSYIPYMVERLATIHQITVEEMTQHTTTNAGQLFQFPT